MEQWDFVQDEERRWCWRCYRTDGYRADSKSVFDSRTDCIADAMRNGYLSAFEAACPRNGKGCGSEAVKNRE